MPVESVPDTGLTYYLIAFDPAGRERAEGADGLLSRRVADELAREPVTDVFLLSHGWQGDIPAARAQYGRWIGAMARCPEDVARMRQARPGFRPLLVGLHWPSLPFGDEGPGGPPPAAGTDPAGPLIEQAAGTIADTPPARAALREIFDAAAEDIAPPTLPPPVRAAYEVLNREAALGSGGVAAGPGADREPFDPERYYQAAGQDGASFGVGGFVMGGILSLLQQLSFWRMKDRACRFGEAGGSELLAALQKAAPEGRGVRFHLMGHSFGCIVMSATLAGPGGSALVRPVDSLALVQGALSLWSYSSDIPVSRGRAGYFAPVVGGGKVAGPIITTQSELDTAVGRIYPWAAGVARQVSFAPGELPRYGAIGAFGIRGPGPDIVDLSMLPADAAYPFASGKVYNLDGSRYIREGGGWSGAHSDIAGPEVAHAVWQAALPR